MLSYRVWCENKNEWEKDDVYLSRSGTLVSVGKFGHLKPLRSDTHIVEVFTNEYDIENKPIYKGDIVEFNFGDKILRKIVNFKNSSFWLDDHCNDKTFIPFGILRMSKTKVRVVGNIHQGVYIHRSKESCGKCGGYLV